MVNGKKIGVLKIQKKTMIDLAFVLFFSEAAIRAFVSTILNYVGMSFFRNIVILGIHILTAIFIVIGIFTTNKGKSRDGIVLYLIIALTFFVSYLINPGVASWYTDDVYGLSQTVFVMNGGVLAYIIIRLQISKERIFSNLKMCNVLWILYLFYLTMSRIQLGYWETTSVTGLAVHSAYHMSYGYNCAFICTLNYILWKKERRAIYIPFTIVFFTTSIMFGSRGVILVYMLFVAAQVWTSLQKSKSWKKLLLITFVVITALLIFTFYSQILYAVQAALHSLGIESRTLNSLLMGEFTEANGRDRIWQIVSEMIKNKFPLGYGAYGDRPIVGQYYGWGYSHNIFLELTVSFGFVGVIISAFLVFSSVRLIINTKDQDWNMLFVLFFVNCGQLLISNSFWYLSYFWAAIAIGTSYSKELKKNE